MFLDLLFSKRQIIKIVDMPTITGTEVGAILRQYTDKLWLSDGTFRLVDTANLQEFLASDPVNTRAYKAEAHDCDDFSYELMGRVSEWNPDNTFGIVWGLTKEGYGHAWNFFIDEDMKVQYVEPQNDTIFAPSTEKIWMMIV